MGVLSVVAVALLGAGLVLADNAALCELRAKKKDSKIFCEKDEGAGKCLFLAGRCRANDFKLTCSTPNIQRAECNALEGCEMRNDGCVAAAPGPEITYPANTPSGVRTKDVECREYRRINCPTAPSSDCRIMAGMCRAKALNFACTTKGVTRGECEGMSCLWRNASKKCVDPVPVNACDYPTMKQCLNGNGYKCTWSPNLGSCVSQARPRCSDNLRMQPCKADERCQWTGRKSNAKKQRGACTESKEPTVQSRCDTMSTENDCRRKKYRGFKICIWVDDSQVCRAK